MKISFNRISKTLFVTGFISMMIFNCQLSNKQLNNSNMTYREKAIVLIENSEYGKEYAVNKNKIRVSDELIPFYEIGAFFLDFLLSEGFKESDFADFTKFAVVKDSTLQQLSTKENSKTQLFFSPVKNSIFFVELFNCDYYLQSYENVPDQGESIAFMFQKKGSSISLIGSQEINYD